MLGTRAEYFDHTCVRLVSDLGFLPRTNGSHSSLSPLQAVFREELVEFPR